MEVERILEKIVSGYRAILGDKLAGVYLHGSLAFGCFTWEKSDVDFIALVYAPLCREEKRAILDLLMALTPVCPPKGLEMSVVLLEEARNFRYPTPFELHFSREWIPAIQADAQKYMDAPHGGDPDLAAHFTVIRAVGKTLWGLPIDQAFSPVPKADYIASIRGDVENAEADILQNPVYVILNLCRVSAYLKNERVLSKREGGEWGIKNLPECYEGLIRAALMAYENAGQQPVWEESGSAAFARYMLKQISEQAEAFRFEPMSRESARDSEKSNLLSGAPTAETTSL